jgi:thioredoxin-like negative regulator of GroEL
MALNMAWLTDLDSALQTARTLGKPVLLQFYREACAGCEKMYARTYPDADVERELFQWFIPVRLDIMKHREVRSRFSAYWAPSFYFLDVNGKLIDSFNGYFGIEDFRIVMRLGKAAVDLPRGRYRQVIELMDDGLNRFPDNPRAGALLFTRGMAEFLIGQDHDAFRAVMQDIVERYPDSPEARMWPWMDGV